MPAEKNRSNTLEIKQTKGKVSAAAVTVAGTGHVIKGQYADGPIALAAATACTVDVEAPHGVTGVKSPALHRMVRVNGSLIEGG